MCFKQTQRIAYLFLGLLYKKCTMSLNIPVFTPLPQSSFFYPLQPILRYNTTRCVNSAYYHNVYTSPVNQYLPADMNTRTFGIYYGSNSWESWVSANGTNRPPPSVTNWRRVSWNGTTSRNRNMNLRKCSKRKRRPGSRTEHASIAGEFQISVKDGEREVETLISPTSNEVLCSESSTPMTTEDFTFSQESCGLSVPYTNAGLGIPKRFCMRELYKGQKRNFCGPNSSFKTILKTHYKNRIRKKLFICKECGKQFSQESNLMSHYSVHSGNREFFSCDVCGKQFFREDSFKSHYKNHKKTFKCQKCEQQFSLQRYLNKHYKKCSVQKKFACEVCGKEFYTVESVEDHCKTHTRRQQMSNTEKLQISVSLEGEREVEVGIPIWKMWTAVPSQKSLNEHRTKYNGKETFMCKVCEKPFCCKSVLSRHQETHGKGKAFLCEACGQQFSKRTQLKEHYKIHTGLENL